MRFLRAANDFDGYSRIVVPDVPLEVYSFLNFSFHVVFSFLSLQRVKLLLLHLAKA